MTCGLGYTFLINNKYQNIASIQYKIAVFYICELYTAYHNCKLLCIFTAPVNTSHCKSQGIDPRPLKCWHSLATS